MNSITKSKEKKSNKNQRKIRWWAVLVWLFIWQIGSMVIGQEVLLVSPFTVFKRLTELAVTSSFWLSIVVSIMKILGGFLLAMVMGTLLAGLSARFVRLRELLEPLVVTIKSIPVASFIILVLFWINATNLSIIISFLMVFPVIYSNLIEGYFNLDNKLDEMAEVFNLSLKTRTKYIYFSQLIPYFQSAVSISLGICWKAGVAAEVIGLPAKSIGINLYNAKVYLDTPDLFAWTVVIICISILFEKIFLFAIKKIICKLEKAI